MESFLQIAEICLEGCVSNKELHCFSLHIDIIEQMKAESFTDLDLQELGTLIQRWKKKFFKLYSNLTETVWGIGGVNLQATRLLLVGHAYMILYRKASQLQIPKSGDNFACDHYDPVLGKPQPSIIPPW